MLILSRQKRQLIHMIDHIPHDIPALNFILQLREYLPDLILDGLRVINMIFFKFLEVGKQLSIYKDYQVIVGYSLIMIQLSVFIYRMCPGCPSVLFIKDILVLLTLQLSLIGLLIFKVIQILQK